MEVSNFATNFTLQEFPFHNEFTDIWQVDKLGYVPYYGEGHLDNITEDLSYDDFTNAFTTDSYSSLDDSLNMDIVDDTLSKVDFSDSDIVTEIFPIENLFDYGWDSSDIVEI